MKQAVAKEVAEADFERFCELAELDVSQVGMDDDDKKSFLDAKRRVVNALMQGTLVIDDKGTPVLSLRGGTQSSLVFHQPTGATMLAMDQRKKNHDISKMYASLAEMTQVPADTFAKMDMRDLKVAQAVFSLFLG